MHNSIPPAPNPLPPPPPPPPGWPPGISTFFALDGKFPGMGTRCMTKVHNAIPLGRPIVSGSGGSTEHISSFVDSILQPIAQKQESYIKDILRTL